MEFHEAPDMDESVDPTPQVATDDHYGEPVLETLVETEPKNGWPRGLAKCVCGAGPLVVEKSAEGQHRESTWGFMYWHKIR